MEKIIKEYILSFSNNKYIYKYLKLCSIKYNYDINKYNFHHIIPSFLYKINDDSIIKKNRYNTLSKLDESFNPLINVKKLKISHHILAHYYLGLGLQTKDAINSFYTLIGDYSKDINSYTEDEVKELAKLVEENSNESVFDHYLTMEERKEKYKEFQSKRKRIRRKS